MEGNEPEFRVRPFSAAPDPRFVFAHQSFRAAFEAIWRGIAQSPGVLTLTGGPGTGKTTLLRRLKDEVEAQGGRVFFRFHPRLGFDELLAACCEDADIYHGGADSMEKLRALARYLRARAFDGSPTLLIIDDAHRIADDLLRKLELLTEIREGERSLLQVLLAGNRDLDVRLERDDLAEVRQHVGVAAQLYALGAEEVGPYIRYRMQVAGIQRTDYFDSGIVRRIARYSGGVPLLINRVCDRALQSAISAGLDHVTDSMIESAAESCRLIDDQAWLARGAAFGHGRAAAGPSRHPTLARTLTRRPRLFPGSPEAVQAQASRPSHDPAPEAHDDLGTIDWEARWRAVQPTMADLYAVPPAPNVANIKSSAPATALTATRLPRTPQGNAGRTNGGGTRLESVESGLRRLTAPQIPASAPWGAVQPARAAQRESPGDRITRRLGVAEEPVVAPAKSRYPTMPLTVAAFGALLISGAAFLYYDEWRQDIALSGGGIARIIAPAPGVGLAPSRPTTPATSPSGAPRRAETNHAATGPNSANPELRAAPATPAPPEQVEPAAGPPPRVPSLPPPALLTPTMLPPIPAPPDAATPRSIDAPSPRPLLSATAVAQLLARGQELMRLGDPASARLVFERAAADGNAAAATGVGRTFDPVEFAHRRIRGVPPDPDQAELWYKRGLTAGDGEAALRLDELKAWRRQQSTIRR